MGLGIFRFTRVAIISCLFLATTLWLSGCRGVGASPSSGNGNGNGGGGSTAPTIVSFAASSNSTSPGTSVNLTWQTKNATQVSINQGIGVQPANGSVTVTPSSNTTYTLTAQGSGGQTASANVTVNVKAGAPTVQVTANPTTISNGQLSAISWTTTNATAINFNPVILGVEGEPLSLPTGTGTVTPTQTTTYVATVTGPGGTATASVTITVNQVPPTATFSANPTSILSGQSSTLSWAVSNATSVSIDNGVGTNEPTTGSATVSPTSTTTYTLTATGLGGTVTAQATVTVAPPGTLAVTITANPASISPGQSTTLTWQSQNAVSVDVEPAPGPNQMPSGTATESPTSTTTYVATAKDINNNTATSSFTVTVIGSGDMTKIKHIIFYVQENRSFDMYFGELGNYRASRGVGSASDLDTFNPNVTLTGIQGIQRNPYHQRTVLTDNLTPSWNESHYDLDRPSGTTCTPNPSSNCKMDRFMITTKSIPQGLSRDPNGDRALGYYDQTDLPYYYELATQFATSDRWFSPLLSQTEPNRMYLFAATSFGHILNRNAPPSGGWPQPTIFDALDKAGITWRYYFLDNSVYLAQWATFQKDSGKVVGINAPTLGWFQVLAQPNADQLLPQVIFIERGSVTGLDEHPDANIQKGAATAANIINALLKSPAWATSAMIFTYDEGGGLYDHVPPFPEVEPDNVQPMLQPGDLQGSFNESGFRVPMVVISPWVRPNFVSHVNRDNTAILKFIETRFNVPSLTARDAAQDNMLEFFDFSSPHLLTPPPLPTQPTNGTANMNLETHP